MHEMKLFSRKTYGVFVLHVCFKQFSLWWVIYFEYVVVGRASQQLETSDISSFLSPVFWGLLSSISISYAVQFLLSNGFSHHFEK